MSDMLTPGAVFEDCRRLCLIHDRMDSFLNECMDTKRDIARLGALSRAGSIFVPHVLTQEKEKMDRDGGNSVDCARLAYALGGITHYPADIMMKPLLRQKANADWHQEHLRMKAGGPALDSPAREVSAYYDTHVFRKVYLAGREEPFTSFLMADNSTDAGQELEAFIYSLFQRALLSSHTLAPDTANLDEWLDNLLEKVQPLYIDVRAFADVFMDPVPEKMQEYGVEDEFYLETDPAIVIARRVQAGSDVPAAELCAALDESANSSAYAKAVCIGVRCLIEASEFWNGERDAPPDVRQGQR